MSQNLTCPYCHLHYASHARPQCSAWFLSPTYLLENSSGHPLLKTLTCFSEVCLGKFSSLHLLELVAQGGNRGNLVSCILQVRLKTCTEKIRDSWVWQFESTNGIHLYIKLSLGWLMFEPAKLPFFAIWAISTRFFRHLSIWKTIHYSQKRCFQLSVLTFYISQGSDPNVDGTPEVRRLILMEQLITVEQKCNQI